MLRQSTNEVPREIQLWLEENSVPVQRYLLLMPGEMRALRGLVSRPRRPATRGQLEDLYKKLFFSESAGRDSPIDPVQFMPDDQLDEVFAPVPPSRTLADYEKY